MSPKETFQKNYTELLKKLEKNHEISEDESHKAAEDIQKMTDKFVAEIDKVAQVKEKNVMDV